MNPIDCFESHVSKDSAVITSSDHQLVLAAVSELAQVSLLTLGRLSSKYGTYFEANQTQMQRFWRTTNALYSIDFQIQRLLRRLAGAKISIAAA